MVLWIEVKHWVKYQTCRKIMLFKIYFSSLGGVELEFLWSRVLSWAKFTWGQRVLFSSRRLSNQCLGHFHPFLWLISYESLERSLACRFPKELNLFIWHKLCHFLMLEQNQVLMRPKNVIWHFQPYEQGFSVHSAMYGHPYLVLKHGTVSFSFRLVKLYFAWLRFLKIIQKMTKNRVLIIYGISWLIPFWTQRDMETFKSQLNYVQTNKVTLKNLLSTSF